MISEEVEGRLFNFKFRQAADALDRQTEPFTSEESSMIANLATLFGDTGWFSGSLSLVLWANVKFLCETPKVTEDDVQRVPDEPEVPQERGGGAESQ